MTTYFIIVFACIVFSVFQQIYAEYLFMHPQAGRPFFTPGFEMHRNGFNAAHMSPFQYFHRNDKNFQPRNPQMQLDNGFFSMPAFFWIGGIRRSLSGILSILLAGSFIRVALQWFKTEQQKEELEIQRLNDELGLLKAQVNPHFLFNSLNTVYSLARKNSQHTEEFILKLSDILRYVIYESSAQKVLVSNELKYIKNYIELQKYRIDKNMQIDYACYGDEGSLLIEPMLLITFVENAFKHGISYREGSFINVAVAIEKKCLYLTVRNTYNKQLETNEYSGIGLQNVKKRLQLSYPSSHKLAIADDNKIYNVHLTIKLDE